MVWRYSGQLMGVHPDLLFVDLGDVLALQRIAALCEPPPSLESCQLANGLIHAVPVVAGIEETEARRRLTCKIYRISRAMIDDEMADALRFPPGRSMGALALLRVTHRLDQFLEAHVPAIARRCSAGRFHKMLDLSHFDPGGLSYRVPNRLHAEEDRPL